MAFAMYSSVPMPKIEWSEKSMRYAMAAFPLVGVVISALMALWLYLSSILQADRMVMALGLMLIPLIISGGIHMDGLADTMDALASHAEREKKRKILKDTHIGAFACIGIGAYLVAYFVIAAQLQYEGDAWIQTAKMICLVPIIERTMSGIVTVAFPGSSSEGLLATFREGADKKGALIALFVILGGCAVYSFACLGWVTAVVLLGATALITLYLYVMSKRQFGGMSGDLAGYYLQLIEIVLLALIALLEAFYL